MTNAEFVAELHRRGVRSPAANRAVDDLDHLDKRGFAELVPDLIRLQLGKVTRERAHPLAARAFAERLSIEELAKRSGTSVTSSDFNNLMADSFGLLMQSTFSGATADIERCCADFDAVNYRPVPIGHVSMATPIEVHEDTGLEKLAFSVTEGERSGALREFGGAFSFSRQVWSVHGNQLPAMIQRHASQTFPSIERQLLASTLASATCESVVAPATVAGVNTATNALRTQENAAGQRLNLEMHTVILPPELEGTFRVLRAALQWPNLALVVNPYLTAADTWFGLCDHRWSAPLLRLRLRGTRAPSIFSGVSPEGNPRFAIDYSVDILHSAVPGLVKCTAT